MSPNKCPFSYATTKNMLISKEKVTMIQYLQLLNNHCQFLLYSSTDISSVLNEKQCQQSLRNKNMNSALFNPLTPLDGYIYMLVRWPFQMDIYLLNFMPLFWGCALSLGGCWGGSVWYFLPKDAHPCQWKMIFTNSPGMRLNGFELLVRCRVPGRWSWNTWW